MALIAIIHIPDHTTVTGLDPSLIADYLDADIVQTGGRVVGLFDFPHRRVFSCTGNCVRKGNGAWTRDQMGFVKCAVCGSRSKRIRRGIIGHLFDWFGANLLGNRAPALFRTPEGYGPLSSRTTD